MTKSILLQCWRGSQATMNLGEWLCEPILAMLGYQVRYLTSTKNGNTPALMMIGSEFHRPHVHHVLGQVNDVWVWGQGNGRPELPSFNVNDELSLRVHVAAVRGPITANISGYLNVPQCDPGWLIPLALPMSKRNSGEVLYVPHHSHRDENAPYVDVIMDQASVVPFIQRLVNASFVFTSSLHVMICAMAYETPCAMYLKPSQHLNMPQKWRDVFGDIPTHCETVKEGETWWKSIGRHYKDMQCVDDLLNVFPHQIGGSCE
jgi:hypothetical protein